MLFSFGGYLLCLILGEHFDPIKFGGNFSCMLFGSKLEGLVVGHCCESGAIYSVNTAGKTT
jgi:hypothetical protein